MLNRILAVAVVAGALAGIAVTALHMVWAVPLILEAETYETGGSTAGAAPVAAHDHAHGALAHDHGHGAAAADDGGNRTLKTLIGNIIVGVGGALIMAGVFALLGDADWRRGLGFGAAAFAAFGLAPALGLPPELPGTAAAELSQRQLWWAGTAAATLAGLAAIVYGSKAWMKAAGALLVTLPHLIGAPQPDAHSALAPVDLQNAFIVASITASAVFWVLLGGLTGYFAERFRATRSDPEPDAA